MKGSFICSSTKPSCHHVRVRTPGGRSPPPPAFCARPPAPATCTYLSAFVLALYGGDPNPPEGQAQDFRFGYSTFSKVEKLFGHRCMLHSFQCRRPLVSHCKRPSPTAPLGFPTAGWNWEGGVELGWIELRIWGRCQLGVATGPL